MPPALNPATIKSCPKNALFLETESNAPGGRGAWYARVPSEHTIDDVLRGEYFGFNASEQKSLRAGDVIDIEPEDARWRLQVRVMAVFVNERRVVTREQQRAEFRVKAPPGYRFVWKRGERIGHAGVEGAHWAIFKGEIEVLGNIATEVECLAAAEELRRGTNVA